MAIKISNQITFTEQKKILEIKEWYLATNQSTDVTRDTIGWTEEIQIIDEVNQYLWNYEEVIYSLGPSEKSDPVIVGFYGKGIDGKGIADIKNYYYITSSVELPDNPEWTEIVPILTPSNKYLWNYEEIIYTDGTSKVSPHAIIGVYGDSGSDTVDFQIYSVDGFEFSDTLTSIELKTVACQNGKLIEPDSMTYQWKWWNGNKDIYEVIDNETSSSFKVYLDDKYALTSLKCEATYQDIVYEDYVYLTKKMPVYTAITKFFDDNNIISADEDYLIAYIELYKDNIPEEMLYSNKVYWSTNNSVEDNIIVTDISDEYSDGDMLYFVYQKTNDNNIQEYDVVLGQYQSNKWNVVQNNYVYKNNLFLNTTSHVIFIPKEKITRSLNINCEVYNDNAIIARTDAMVLDLNDPIISSSAPTNPKDGQLWLDLSVSPSILKMWNGSEWVNSGYQNGNVVYTSQPVDGYSKGDLWILSESDQSLFEDFGEGTMLKANTTSDVFDISHWEDVDTKWTEQKKNISQYFLFNKNTGLRIGRSDNKFYVNISATKMSFCEDPLINSTTEEEVNDPNEVVSISNRSATIRNLTVEDGATFNCEIKFGRFILKTENNGSLSLALES